MKTKLFDSSIVGNAQEAVDFIGNILESSTESHADRNVIQTNDLGPNAYVVKPVDLDQLVTIVKRSGISGSPSFDCRPNE
jgi:DNA-binding NarL/FixJ family response regulator